MNTTMHTPEQAAEAVPFITVLEGARPDKRLFAKAIAEAFINGMQTQERLASEHKGA